MPTISRSAALASALLLAWAAHHPSTAQEATPSEGAPFSEVVDVRVVNLEVVVTDRDGVPVRGLGPDDLVLEVDGEETSIDYFTEVQGGRAVTTGSGGGSALPTVPAIVKGEALETSYLVFIDDYFAFEDDRNRALDGIVADLGLLGEGDRMAVVAFDGRRIDMLSSWSRSVLELERVFEDARRRPARGLQRLAELRQLEVGAPARPLGLAERVDPETKAFVLRLADQVDRLVDGAAATMRGFAMPPGRKVLLLVTGGWPYRPTEFVTGDPVVRTELALAEGEELFAPLADTANLLGYTIYPIDTSGHGTRWTEAPGAASRATPGNSDLAFYRRTERQNSSRFVARATGGRALFFDDAEQGFAQAVADTRSFYWLGFTPQRSWDDEEHEISVRARSRDLEVRSRESFLDSSRSAEVTMQVESALLFGSLYEAPELEVTVGEWRKAGFRKMELPLTLSLPLSALTFIESGDRLVAEVEVRLAVQDELSNRAAVPVIPLRLESPGRPGAEEQWRYTVPLKLRRKPHDALVAVYDVGSGRILTSGVEIRP